MEFQGCWNYKYFEKIDPETDRCTATDTLFEDKLYYLNHELDNCIFWKGDKHDTYSHIRDNNIIISSSSN